MSRPIESPMDEIKDEKYMYEEAPPSGKDLNSGNVHTETVRNVSTLPNDIAGTSAECGAGRIRCRDQRDAHPQVQQRKYSPVLWVQAA